MLIGRKTIGTICYMGGIMGIPEPFVKCWGDMLQYNAEYLIKPTERIFYNRATVSYHSFARNSLIDAMQGDFILMLDTDIMFEPDLAARMLHRMNTYDIDVLTCMYPYKAYPHAPVLYGRDSKTKEKYVIGNWQQDVSIMQIDSAGAGCLMIRRNVVDRFVKHKQNLFEQVGDLSEDHSFFERLRRLKMKAYVALDIEIGHLIYKTLTIKDDYPREDMRIGKRNLVEGFKV